MRLRAFCSSRDCDTQIGKVLNTRMLHKYKPLEVKNHQGFVLAVCVSCCLDVPCVRSHNVRCGRRVYNEGMLVCAVLMRGGRSIVFHP